MDKKHYQLIIIGSGPAGCTAAIYAARANLNFAMITGLEQGGQLMKTPKIANWPGEPEKISGTLLMEKMIKQVRNFSVNILSDYIEKADLSKRPFYLKGGESIYTCDALIIATGSSAKFLGVPSEQKYIGKGISTCSVCDGFFYKNKEVIIVGSDNTAIEQALYLAKIAKQVTLIHRSDTMHAEKQLVRQLKNISNIKLALNCRIVEILGDEQGVTGVHIKDINSNTNKKIAVDGIFVAIGHKPNTEIFSGQLEVEHDSIKTGYNYTTGTSVAGVFAAGDVVSQNYHQAIIAAGSGCIAALDVKKFLTSWGAVE
jgi:thioredoxin reductase (NADPH)